MPLDTKRFPMLNDLAHPARCPDCDSILIRSEGFGIWYCPADLCGADPVTDAELDTRLQSAAEAAFERTYKL